MAAIQHLNDLLDVSVPAPADGDVLYWDAPASLWKSKPILAGEGGILERLVRASLDDIWVYWTGVAWSSLYTEQRWSVGYWDSSVSKTGGAARFLNIYIPKGATITHAYLKVVARNTDSTTEVKSRLHGEKNATPATFSSTDDYHARTRTDAVIDWDDIPSWTLGELYQSPDIKTLIKEIIDLDAWASGNPLVVFWDDHDDRSPHVNYTQRRARSWNHPERTPPMLYIEWTA